MSQIWKKSVEPEGVNFQLHFLSTKEEPTLQATYGYGTTVITVDAVGTAAVGDYIEFINADDMQQLKISDIDGNDITLNSPIEYTYGADDYVRIGSNNAAVNGSVTPVTYSLKIPYKVKWVATNFVFIVQDAATMDTSTFGSIANGLTNGIQFQFYVGAYGIAFTPTIIYNNGDIISFQHKSEFVAAKENALISTGEFHAPHAFSNHIDGFAGDEFRFVIRDDISSQTRLSYLAKGKQSV